MTKVLILGISKDVQKELFSFPLHVVVTTASFYMAHFLEVAVIKPTKFNSLFYFLILYINSLVIHIL